MTRELLKKREFKKNFEELVVLFEGVIARGRELSPGYFGFVPS